MPAPAHILSPAAGWGIIVWMPVGVVLAGVLAWALGGVRLRRAGSALAAAGLVATVVLRVAAPSAPPRPSYELDVVSPRAGAQVSSPVAVVVCGRQPDGSAAPVPGAGRALSVSIDGSQIEAASASSVLVDASPGPHDIVVDVLTSDHRSFDPAVEVTVHVTVSGPARIGAPPTCPG